jgi:hypothetical protein
MYKFTFTLANTKYASHSVKDRAALDKACVYNFLFVQD